MALSISYLHLPHFFPLKKTPIHIHIQIPFPSLNPNFTPKLPSRPILQISHASNRSQPSPSSSSSAAAAANKTKKKKKKRTPPPTTDSGLKDVEIIRSNDDFDDDDRDNTKVMELPSSPRGFGMGSRRASPVKAAGIPKPPAGFVLDDAGNVALVSEKRVTTIVDSTNNWPLDCVIRRVFRTSNGDECLLLCPLDTPILILKSTNGSGWTAVNYEEADTVLPAAAYALAKIHMHLVLSGFCHTARGGFCFSEDDIFDFCHDDVQDKEGLPTEGVEITCFQLDGAHYMIYTPSDPLLFVAVKDKNGVLQIAEDDLLDDPAISDAIDEETEFNALVEEEAIFVDDLVGKR